MGKKGKRSKRNAVMKQVDELFAEYEKLLKEALCDNRKLLYSKAANKLRKTIQLLESKNELKMYTLDKQLVVCYLLMSVEYERKNYKAAIDCYNYIVSKSRNKNFSFSASISLYYQLIMLRLNGQDYQISDFIHEISREKQERSFLFEDTVHAFRAQKQFDAAIRLEMTCGSLRCSTELKSKLSLALTYLERYRIEFHQRAQMRKEEFFTMNSLITRMIAQFPLENNYSPEYCLVLAQWYYLTHTLDGNKGAEEESMQASTSVLDFLYQSLTVYTDEDNGIWEIVQDNCYTCGQAVTIVASTINE
ncbi:predicted protein [Chaetoceros tenuissimus]|uniref:Uncharacterized protein n=1 Tax=Chaetoceros tenuissimus TaxID=426638 RepID=A0AAD3HG96_9STRA|nr:predicted protein [Chaetoceros tenuissimus]